MAKHVLEETYGLTAGELLDAVATRFRLRAALEGAVAEEQIERDIAVLVGNVIERYEAHDLDGVPDFSIWLPGRIEALRAECKNIRESSKAGGEAYREGGKIVAYKVETQKTRASKGDPSSRYHDARHFDILGVCLGKKTGDWSDIVYVRAKELERHSIYPSKLAVFQRVPLPDAEDKRPWYDDLGTLLRDHYR
ncbi:MAG: hypothetical protein HYV60_04770 [Planctomycetia bacterium]|nr:hypothetical protein [Planctomycetia bacterium]